MRLARPASPANRMNPPCSPSDLSGELVALCCSVRRHGALEATIRRAGLTCSGAAASAYATLVTATFSRQPTAPSAASSGVRRE